MRIDNLSILIITAFMSAIILEFYFPKTHLSSPPTSKDFLHHIRVVGALTATKNQKNVEQIDDIMSIYAQAGELLKSGEYEDAISEFNYFIESRPSRQLLCMALASKAFAECSLKKFADAKKSLDQIPEGRSAVLSTYYEFLNSYDGFSEEDLYQIREVFQRFLW